MRIDKEVEKIMNEGLARARELLTKHRHVLDAIATELMRVETMERDEYEKILTLHGIKARRKIGEEPYVAPPPPPPAPSAPVVEVPEESPASGETKETKAVSEDATGDVASADSKRQRKQKK